MNTRVPGLSATLRAAFMLLVCLAWAGNGIADDACQASGDYQFVCGPNSTEDLVLVPGTHFIIGSAFSSGAALYLIDAADKSWSILYPAEEAHSQQDMERYGACPGAPDPAKLVTHGLYIRAGDAGHSTLYVVGHGAREAIEVFAVDASGAKPVATWTGCMMLPEGLAANSVAALANGTLLATIPLPPGKTMSEAMKENLPGAVYQWSPGDSGFTKIEGSAAYFPNGIEISADEQEFYIVSGSSVVAYSNTRPARLLRNTETLAFGPDNLHMGSDGQLLTAGMILDYPACAKIGGEADFSFEEFASCPRPFVLATVNPQTMETTQIADSPANPVFSNVTMVLPVGDELWIGSFASDRIAYRSRH
ncbi:MAG: hypothetical protein KBG75_00610 [Pseudomonadales bacterium]|nr:hypothetical protein [Pseudomonadales bacterium]